MSIAVLGMVVLKLLLVINFIAVAAPATASEQDLADAIEYACNFSDETISEEQKEDCMLYYVNCVIGKGGKWTDKDLFKCMKEKKN
jgi:hypothetical protein